MAEVVSLPCGVGCNSCRRLWQERNELASEVARLRALVDATAEDGLRAVDLAERTASQNKVLAAKVREAQELVSEVQWISRASLALADEAQTDAARLRGALRPLAELVRWAEAGLVIDPIELLNCCRAAARTA